MNLLVLHPCTLDADLDCTMSYILQQAHTHQIFMFSGCKDFQTKLCVGKLTPMGWKEKNKRLCVLWVKVEKMEEGCLYICVRVIGSKALIGCLHWAACHHAWSNQLSLSWNLWRLEDDGGDGWTGRTGRGALTEALREEVSSKKLDKIIFAYIIVNYYFIKLYIKYPYIWYSF